MVPSSLVFILDKVPHLLFISGLLHPLPMGLGEETKRSQMEFDGSNWVKYGFYFLSGLLGGVMISCGVLSLSTSFFGMTGIDKKKSAKRKIRVFMDGCFDPMHYGHANALRQAKALGDELVVGVASDEVIASYKGPPVLSMQERLALVSGLKWVDEVIPNVPYEFTEDFMNILFQEHKIDYIVHGDDPVILHDGTDGYGLAKKVGRYKQIKRTEGVSSTDIVGRILSCNNYLKGEEVCGESSQASESGASYGHISHFLPTSRRIVQFSNGKGPGLNSRVVYIDGAFDLFHTGHMEILKIARQRGDFLLVGIYGDETISDLRGNHFPLMNLLERSLSVLACRYVDDVIIGAPFRVTKDMITTLNISLVVHGTISEKNTLWDSITDPYAVPKSIGIYQLLESPKDITTSSIARRILVNHEIYVKRNQKKEESEKRYYAEKKYVAAD